MKYSYSASIHITWIFLLIILGIEPGCHYYYVSKSKQNDVKHIVKDLADNLKENRNILIYNEGKYYSLSNLAYNADTTALTASCKADTSYHVYNPYFDSVMRYRLKRGEEKVLKEVYIISDVVKINRDNMVTVPLSSILRTETIKNNPGRSVGNAFLCISGAALIGVLLFGEDLPFGNGF